MEDSYCFHVKRVDGTEEDFSYRVALGLGPRIIIIPGVANTLEQWFADLHFKSMHPGRDPPIDKCITLF